MRALIVEDEILVALDIESVLRDQGIEVIAIAADRPTAMRYADQVDFALVDINLRDGQTGPAIGRSLAVDHGVAVIFITANPGLLGEGVEGATGVMTKPFSERCIGATVDYLARRNGNAAARPPRELHLFG
ncbi:response regulator [Sphingomonas sp. LaA6.9]|uniref:response regulator n=1 Tax=Sphingomonas sp. LaA6.9 TaxID=2919914 RepID=UPI001F4F6511|nr:response regulator [Sphingomonas sp. LaA6.9]MCJ8155851.1 response regulator [Sphingomonas sp. LaA6.9]